MFIQKSEHQMQVEAFMLRAKQEVPMVPTEPSLEVRKLRARLIMEEALELIENGLGLYVEQARGEVYDNPIIIEHKTKKFNMVELIDGCCDLKVVTTGTLSACGIPDVVFQDAVDYNNLTKFGPGHTLREDGKLVKPPGHQPPPIVELLQSLIDQIEADRGFSEAKITGPIGPEDVAFEAEVKRIYDQPRSQGGQNLGKALYQAEKNLAERKVQPIVESNMSKGGQNHPIGDEPRPPAPGGSAVTCCCALPRPASDRPSRCSLCGKIISAARKVSDHVC